MYVYIIVYVSAIRFFTVKIKTPLLLMPTYTNMYMDERFVCYLSYFAAAQRWCTDGFRVDRPFVIVVGVDCGLYRLLTYLYTNTYALAL